MKKSKKGFTLIEMLVVIAIVAILVAVIMPSITVANIKAAAATNAANLRSVEAAVSSVYLQSPEKFDGGDIATGVAERVGERVNEISESVFGSTNRYMVEMIMDIVERIVDTAEDGATYYAVNEVITIDDTAVSAPKAKALVFDGIELRKNTEMTVTITEGIVVATYDGLTVDYFAAVAETGKADASGHSYRDSNRDGMCDICNTTHTYNGTYVDKITGKIEDVVKDMVDQEVGNAHTCTDANGDNDHTCDIEGCYLPASPCNTDGEGCTCSECGKQGEHNYRWSWSGTYCTKCGAKR